MLSTSVIVLRDWAADHDLGQVFGKKRTVAVAVMALLLERHIGHPRCAGEMR
jgi:hypothetical protein